MTGRGESLCAAILGVHAVVIKNFLKWWVMRHVISQLFWFLWMIETAVYNKHLIGQRKWKYMQCGNTHNIWSQCKWEQKTTTMCGIFLFFFCSVTAKFPCDASFKEAGLMVYWVYCLAIQWIPWPVVIGDNGWETFMNKQQAHTGHHEARMWPQA